MKFNSVISKTIWQDGSLNRSIIFLKKKDTHVFHMSKAIDKVMVDIVLISYSYGNNCNISLQLQKI